MTRNEMIAELRFVIGDTVPPYRWSESRLLRWLTEGDDRFCEQSGFYLDTTTYTIVTTEGDKAYAIPSYDRIIQINEVWDGDRRLIRFNQRNRPTTETFVETPTRPNLYQVDQNTGMLTLYDYPAAGITLSLEVWRRSTVALNHKTGSAYDAVPEIPYQFELAPIEYAAYKAYNDHDAEKLDMKKSRDHMAEFQNYVSLGRRAMSRIHRQTPQVAPSPYYVV
jgi:hypothetical protein